jgi:predicted nucleic acid-binding protein
MEWINQLQGQIVGLDTAPLIYFIEQNSLYLATVRPFFLAMSRGEFQVVASTLLLTEVLVHPLRNGNTTLAEQYRSIILSQTNLKTVSISAEIAQRAAYLRAMYNWRTPDALVIATSISEGATFLLTNDSNLATATELNVLVVNDVIP